MMMMSRRRMMMMMVMMMMMMVMMMMMMMSRRRMMRGEGGSLSPGRSGIRGPARPFASQSKTQGSPLGGYLS